MMSARPSILIVAQRSGLALPAQQTSDLANQPAQDVTPPQQSYGKQRGLRPGLKSQARSRRLYTFPYAMVAQTVVENLMRLPTPITFLGDTKRGATIECSIPMDWRSFSGTFFVEVNDLGQEVEVTAHTALYGQLLAWGKGRELIGLFFVMMTAELPHAQ